MVLLSTKRVSVSQIVAYYRVSTKKQGELGLGLEAQRNAVAIFAAAEGLEIIDEFTEVETGKGVDALDRRPQLRAALKAARLPRAASASRSSTGSRATSPSSAA